MANILLIEPSQKVTELLTYALRFRGGHQTLLTPNAGIGFHLAAEGQPDMILLDDAAQDMDVVHFCQRLRKSGNAAPVLVFLSHKDKETVWALKEAGCGTLVKPFSTQGVLGCVHAALRETALVDPLFSVRRDRQEFCRGRIVIDRERRVVLKDGEILELSQRDYELLCCLSDTPGKVFTRKELLENVWCYKNYLGDIRGVDVAVRRLRQKLEDNPAKPEIIRTRRGVGYYWGTTD